MDDFTMNRIRFLLWLAFVGNCCSANLAAELPPLWKPPGTLAVIDIPDNGAPLLVPVRIGQREFRYILDTGSSHTVISDTVKLGDEISDGSTPPRRRVEDFRMAGIRCEWLKSALVVNLEHAKKAGINADGIVGADVLSNFVIHCDFDNQKMLLVNAEVPYEPFGEEIELTCDKLSRPFIKANLAGIGNSPYLIDTGNLLCVSTNAAEYDRVAKLVDTRSTGIRIQASDAFGEMVIRHQMRCRGMSFGRSNWIGGVVISPGEENMIGLQQLCRFRLTLDWRNNKSYWAQGSRYKCRDRGDGCGFSYKSYDDSLDVLSVTPNSLASAAGLHAGDRIIEIDMQPIKLYPRGKWSRLLSFPRVGPLQITVKRREDIVKLQIVEE